MKITNNNLHNVNIYNRERTPVTKPLNGLASDVFQKSNVSFSGSENEMESLIDSLLDELFNPARIEKQIESFFDDLLESVEKEIEDLTSYLDTQMLREMQVSVYIEGLATKNVSRIILNRKKDRLDELNRSVFGDIGLPVDVEFINELLYSSDIKSVIALNNFIKLYNQTPQGKKIFKDLGIEAIKIYGLLKQKDDFAKFPELLLHMYMQEEESENPNFEKINETTAFLKQIGLNKFSDFETNFAHLSMDFNDFATIQDKIDAIEYLKSTYEPKIQMLSVILQQTPSMQKTEAKKIYSNIFAIVDCLYKKNKGKSLVPLDSIIELANHSGNIKQIPLKNLGDFCNGLKTPEDKIEFLKFLKGCQVSIAEFNTIASKSIISDRDVIDELINKEEISAEISDITGININQTREMYKKTSSEYNVAYNNGDIELLLKVMDDFSVKNSDSLISLYNRINGSNLKSITSQEFLDFIDLFRYYPSKDIFVVAKNKKVLPVEILKEEKQRFLHLENDIECFISMDESGYFAGKTAFDIYSEYKDILLEDSDNAVYVLQRVVDLNISNSEEYNQKAKEILPFRQYFVDGQDLTKFLSLSGIKFDLSRDDEEHKANCLVVLNALHDKNDIEKSQQRINQIVDSGFLLKSKQSLSQLVNSIQNKEDLNKFIQMIADKKIASLSQLSRFMIEYDSNDGSVQNLFKHLYYSPQDVDFAEYEKILTHVHSELDKLYLPSTINNDNIMGINVSDFIDFQGITQTNAGSVLNGLYGCEEGCNFLGALPNALTDKNAEYSKIRIASEILEKISASNESYQNILKKFNIDKRTILSSNAPSYLLAKAISKKIPDEFVDFVNSNEWISYDETTSLVPNLPLHARLRMIDRFAMQEDDLYSDETKQKLNSLIKTVYTQTPYMTRGTDRTHRIIADVVFQNTEIEAVFAPNGEMITIVPKRKDY